MALFGTDGIRGPAGQGPLAPENVQRLGQAIGHLLKFRTRTLHTHVPDWFSERHRVTTSNILGKGRVLIGRDTRKSGPDIEKALLKGFADFGVEAILAGVVSTPGVSQLTRRWGCSLGVVISASHNPASDNGIKLFSQEGLKIPDEAEAEIEGLYQDEEFNPHIKHSRTRRVRKPKDVSTRVTDYLTMIRETFKDGPNLKGMKVVLDCANGANSEWAPVLMKQMGVETVVLHNAPDGENINANCGATNPESLCKATVTSNAALGVAFDGDADRAILSDEAGNIIDGDHVLAMHGIDLLEQGRLNKKTVVGTVMTNHGLQVCFKDRGIRLVRTKVGDRYVLQEMVEQQYGLGGEASGHILFLNDAPVGDGLLTCVETLSLMQRSGRKVSELASVLRKYPQILINVPVTEKPPLDSVEPVQAAVDDVERELGNNGRVVLRYSGTESLCRVMVEGPQGKGVQPLAERIAAAVRSAIGNGQ